MARVAWKRMNRLSDPVLCEKDLRSHCTCLAKSGKPGPQHDVTCAAYATHRVELFKCSDLGFDVIPNVGRGRKKHVPSGPVKLTLVEI